MPPHTLFVEPFVGGGALFFDLEPEAALLNDASADLVDFYRAVRRGDSALREALLVFDRDRERLRTRAAAEAPDFGALLARARMGGDGLARQPLARAAAATCLEIAAGAAVGASVADKARRLVRLEKKHDVRFEGEELPDHYETALLAGYYTAVRDSFVPANRAEELARFFFLRAYCYGSMFRYSKSGRFNIPYGGISYNRVRLERKVERLYSAEVKDLLGRAEFHHGDFEAALAAAGDRLADDSFVFLDPPYDTEFSGYANRAFGREDHERLARAFAALPCPALLVIQRTEFIDGLYARVAEERQERGEPFFSRAYGKTYGYNVRGRNERRATHLLIGNYRPTRTSTGSPPRSAR